MEWVITIRRFQLNAEEYRPFNWYDGTHCFLYKEKQKVRAEIALSDHTYHLRRAITILGAHVLVARIREENWKYKG